jgi:hypothetical protein
VEYFISSLIISVVVLWVFAAWTIVGLLFWIPRLFLAVSQFSALIVLMTMSVSNTDESDLKDILKSAIEFYSNGFILIYNTFFYKNSQLQTKKSVVDWPTVIVRTGYTFFFWLISLSVMLKNYTIFAYFGLPLLFLIGIIGGIFIFGDRK